jgi:hypothetical protein
MCSHIICMLIIYMILIHYTYYIIVYEFTIYHVVVYVTRISTSSYFQNVFYPAVYYNKCIYFCAGHVTFATDRIYNPEYNIKKDGRTNTYGIYTFTYQSWTEFTSHPRSACLYTLSDEHNRLHTTYLRCFNNEMSIF